MLRTRPRSLPRSVRMVLLAMLFVVFFAGSPLLALAIPLLRWNSADPKGRTTRILERAMAWLVRVGTGLGLARVDPLELPAGLDRSKPFVLVANHPTYVDMLFLLGGIERLTCVTNGRWWRHWALGRLLRATNYLPGPGSGLPESEQMLATMVEHLKTHPLLVFPEGQRSLPDRLRRFRRGAVAAAVQANVPLVQVFIAIDRPFLTKNTPVWRPPVVTPTYSFEFFDIIAPEAFAHDAQAIQAEVEARYARRHAAQKALHAANAEERDG